MFQILTVVLLTTSCFEGLVSDLEENIRNISHYNVYKYVTNLNLQICVFVGIGLNYFAIFVEDRKVQNYFLGICHQDTLAEWQLCTNELTKVRKRKCVFELGQNRYHARVHRRFCDFNILVKNKDCQCIPTLFEEDMEKVVGLPTCYIPPLPDSLCKYNVCGLSPCGVTTIEGAVHSVHCNCKGPFCESSNETGTSAVPAITSSWTPWQQEVLERGDGELLGAGVKNYDGEIIQKAFCVDPFMKTGVFDCLGPGSKCCANVYNEENCSCRTFIENDELILRRYLLQRPGKFSYVDVNHQYDNEVLVYYSSENNGRHFRYTRESNYTEDIGDEMYPEDEDESDDDIVLEEKEIEHDDPITTTEELEREEAENELKARKSVGMVGSFGSQFQPYSFLILYACSWCFSQII
ncbi:uncharacterized protein LOC132700931 [Cylas formicarius]|uniref:uncharacterized protein LOC132700931 n=1 Tax=Cylas formicarius TaxID=197179 RepID=UPI002958D32E|nr:uncharacterized protein LOC132700931 [Cylas formicarius]